MLLTRKDSNRNRSLKHTYCSEVGLTHETVKKAPKLNKSRLKNQFLILIFVNANQNILLVFLDFSVTQLLFIQENKTELEPITDFIINRIMEIQINAEVNTILQNFIHFQQDGASPNYFLLGLY